MTRLVVAITGATGSIYGIRLLQVLRGYPDLETHLIISRPGKRTIVEETDVSVPEVEALATHRYDNGDIGAAIASGSFHTAGMVIAPCSIKTAAAVAACHSDNLIARAADVTLKEGRKLLLLVRESPLSAIHLENMLAVARAGALIVPPVPAFYARPRTIDELVDHTVGRVLDHFDVPHDLVRRWGERRAPGWVPRVEPGGADAPRA